MAAGQGFKTFITGEVLTAGDVNGYLMQGINVFTNATARDAAITAPAEGQFAFTKDNNSLWYYDGAAWVASGATGDIEGVTAGVGISGGGTSGTVTITNSMATAIDAKGDLVAGTGADTFSRLAVGANNTVLTADSSTATGLKWAAAAAGGKVLQVIQAIDTGTADNSTNVDLDTGITATITPSATTSKILVLTTVGGTLKNSANANNYGMFKIKRGSTTVFTIDGQNYTSSALSVCTTMSLMYLDSPSTTSATTYKVTIANPNNTAFVSMGQFSCESSIILMEIGA
jgi:hypothetical protein